MRKVIMHAALARVAALAAAQPVVTEPVDKPKVRRATKAEKKAAKRARHESN